MLAVFSFSIFVAINIWPYLWLSLTIEVRAQQKHVSSEIPNIYILLTILFILLSTIVIVLALEPTGLLKDRQTLCLSKISTFHLISWCGNFMERHIFRRVSGESPEALWKLCLSDKCSHQEIR